MQRRVVVTDGEQRAALATVRSLGRAGYSVHVCSSRGDSIAGSSRYCASTQRVADALRDPLGFLADVAQFAKDLDADVLFPITEAALLAVLPHRDRLACVIPFADADIFQRICDKSQVLEAAKQHGIAVPRQTKIATPQDLHLTDGRLSFPLVLKSSRSVTGRSDERIQTGITYVANATQLHDAVEHIPLDAYPLLLQQKIEGPGFGISVLMWNGKLCAAFAHYRIREKPPSGGVSVLSESISLDQNILSQSIALLRDFKWQGVAMVEYKLDQATGIPYLMEINGRFWGSLQLAIDAGVDFPNLLAQCALGMDPAPVVTYKTGVRLRWEWGEVDHLLSSLFPSAADKRSKSRAKRGRFSALTTFLRSLVSSNRSEVFRVGDPMPFLRETADWLRRR